MAFVNTVEHVIIRNYHNTHLNSFKLSLDAFLFIIQIFSITGNKQQF